MAEYTIPKPYRDFYVTNPYIELKESNERLQRIVKSGYVATDSFEGAANQVITFDSPKHGFSLTNDSSKASSWSVDLSSSSSWEDGSIDSSLGINMSYSNRIRTKEKYRVIPGQSYSIQLTSSASVSYSAFIYQYDESDNYLGTVGTWWVELPSTITLNSSAAKIRIVLKITDDSSFSLSDVFPDVTSFKVAISNYTAPSDVTVKVAENVAGIPTTADGWEQGAINNTTGILTPTSKYITTKNFIPVKPLTLYTCKFSTPYTMGHTIYEYDENNKLVQYSQYKAANFKTKQTTVKIKVMFFQDGGITPETGANNIGNSCIISEPMIIQENDTRIVTMPPFTSLYIESNVPYHGHALDLAE